jgi:hypothetical protein
VNKKALIADILKMVDLETGEIDTRALAKRYGERQLDLENFLDVHQIATVTFGGAMVPGLPVTFSKKRGGNASRKRRNDRAARAAGTFSGRLSPYITTRGGIPRCQRIIYRCRSGPMLTFVSS